MMKKRSQKDFCMAFALLLAFILWTAAVCRVDVQTIGPRGSAVGFAALNRRVHVFTGVHMWLYTLTDWLGLVPVGIAFGFAGLGLAQWIKRKSILKVDRSILALGGFYLAVAAAYVYFETHVINVRPVLIEGRLEPSYPSSTTLIVLCVMPTAAMQLRRRIKTKFLKHAVLLALTAFTAFTVMGRLICGVHWITDIIGGAILSAGLVMLYRAVCNKRGKDLLL